MFKSLAILVLLSTQVFGESLEQKAKSILVKHCHECHGAKRESDPLFDVTNWKYLVRPKTNALVDPGNPGNSRIIKRISSNPVEMPPQTRKPLTDEEVGTLSEWIKAGALNWSKEDRPFVDSKYISTMIGMDFRGMGRESENFRYLTLANLYNDGVSESDLSKAHEAVTRVMNFLAHGKDDIRPTALLDELGVVIRIDLRDFGWTASDWDSVVRRYPYGNGVSHMRADWFVAHVSQPPLYYSLRNIPLTEAAFEKQLGIKPKSLIRHAGVTDSQVALHNRAFKRYELESGGYYWKTLNIKDGNPSDVMNLDTFKPDYSVSLYSLSNGLLGFAVFQRDEDKPGVFNRVDKIDIDAEFDPTMVAGTPQNVPMLNCVCCHVTGMQPNIRDVTGGTAINFLDKDKKKFLEAASKTGSTMEPIKSVIERYYLPVDMDKASSDLGVSPEHLGVLLKGRKNLVSLLEGRTVTRRIWESTQSKVTQP